MAFPRNLGKAVKTGVTAYIAGGIAYWMTAEIFIRYIGKEITFSPIISVFLTVPLWPMHVYGDLKWSGVLPQDVAALLALSASIPLLLLRLKHNGVEWSRGSRSVLACALGEANNGNI